MPAPLREASSQCCSPLTCGPLPVLPSLKKPTLRRGSAQDLASGVLNTQVGAPSAQRTADSSRGWCTEFSDWFPNDQIGDPRAQDDTPLWAISSPAYRLPACLERCVRPRVLITFLDMENNLQAIDFILLYEGDSLYAELGFECLVRVSV